MAAFLEKSTGSEGFHQVIDFLSQSHISYALTKRARKSLLFIKQFWRTADQLLLDNDGELFVQACHGLGYQTDSDKLTIQKGVSHLNGGFLYYTLTSLSWPMKMLGSNLSRNIASALICLATNRKYNFSRLIFEHMVTNIGSPHKFLMYPRITSSPSLSFEPSTEPTFEPQPSPDAEYHVHPLLSPLLAVYSHGSVGRIKPNYSDAFHESYFRIKKLESKVKTGKARKRARVVLSEDEEDDSSKQGRIDEDPNTYFHQDDEVVDDVVHDTAEERQPEDSTAGITVSTAPINISTARETRSTAGRVVYGRRSKEARKDKGKAIMTEPEPEKKSKKLLEQERLGLEEAIRLQEQVDKEERAQIARDEEIARQLLALDEERVTTETKTTKDIDWNDPSVQNNYKMKDFEGMSYDEIRPIFEKDNGGKSILLEESTLEQRNAKETKKVEQDDEKEELKSYLDIVPREDVVVDVESLSISIQLWLEILHFTRCSGVIQAGQRKVSDSEKENVSQTKTEKKTVKPSIAKIEFVKPKQQEKTARKTIKQAEKHRQNTHSPRGNQRNWNNMMSQRLGSNFEMFNKACYVCGSFDHLQVDCNYHQKQFQNQRMVKPVWNNAQRVNHQNFAKKTHPCAKKNMVPRAVLMKSGLVSINTARQNISKTAVSVNTARQVNTAHSKTTVNAARPMSYLSKTAHSTVKRPINNNTAFKNSNINQRVNTARPKAVVNAVQGNNVNAVKASACWVWKPKTKVLDHVSKHNSASTILKRFDYIDAQGRSKSVMAWVPKRN
ncbi:hypothetical protein Tco_0217397 [Tanacetum coccineum]